jgi:hypothetical protein
MMAGRSSQDDSCRENFLIDPVHDRIFRCDSHINEPVSLYARGDGSLTKHLRQFEGSWYPCTPVIDNTQLFHAMTNAAGIPQHSPLTAIVTRPTACPAGK